MADDNGSVPAGNPSFDWSATLGQNYEAHKPMIEGKKWADPGAVLTSYSELEKSFTRDRATLSDYEKKFGKVPTDAKEYTFDAPSDFEQYDQGFVDNWFRSAALKAGMTGPQAKALHDEFVAHSRQAYAGQLEKSSQEDKALDQGLRAKWGADYDKNVSVAREAVKQFGTNALILDKLEDIVGSPALIELFATIGEKMGTASLVTGAAPDGSPNGAIGEINKIKNDEEFKAAWLNRDHPKHEEAKRRSGSLHAQAFPDAG